MRAVLAAILLAFGLGFAGPALALSVRFYPGDHVYAYPLDQARGANSVMIHNVAIVNDGDAPVALNNVQVQLLAGQRVLDVRTLGAPELERAAQTGVQLQGELWQLLGFQFGGDRLVPAGTRFAAGTTLAPGEAIVIGSQMFSYRGERDGVRVVVNDGEAEGRLALRNTMSATVFQFPLRGVWYAASGPGFNSGHRWSPMEEFGFDLLQIGADGRSYRGDGARFDEYYAYGAPVLAGADGRVALVVTDQVEDVQAMQQPSESIEQYYGRLMQDQMTRVAGGTPAVVGNAVVIDHGNGEFSHYAHLRPGSVSVRVGDRVLAGQEIGLLGSSGNSTEPHLHFQVCDGVDSLTCAGIPIQFAPSEDPLRGPPHVAQSGDFLQGASAPR